jgi:hypothetical protein
VKAAHTGGKAQEMYDNLDEARIQGLLLAYDEEIESFI